jgi:hemolysin activation/secretion protein
MLSIPGTNYNKVMRLSQALAISTIFFVFSQSPAFAQSNYEPVTFNVSSFKISGDNPLGDKAYSVLKPYLGDQSGLDGLSAAADALEQALISAGYSFHRVSLPPQALNTGNVELQIVRFTVGDIRVSGNQYFDQENILHALPTLQAGESPNTKQLARTLKLANNNAFKNIVLKFREGNDDDSIDAELTVKDQNPQLAFITLDNTGNADTEEFRTTLGYQHGNLFNLDHSLTLTLTVAPQDVSSTRQIGINYHIPLYAHGANLDFLLSDSEVNSGEVADGAAITGKGSVFGFTYTRPLLTDTDFNHQWSAGFQYKNFNNDIDLGSGNVIESDVLSFPLQLGYSFSYNTKSGVLNGGLQLDANIGSGKNNTDEKYDAVRPEAEKSWNKVGYNLSYDVAFAREWLLHFGLSGQKSSSLLIPGEQFGVGGMRTLRGFEERSVTGDSGNQVSLEVWTPAWVGIRFLAFVDQASIDVNAGDITPAASYDLSSAGLGMRWSWKQQLSVSIDYGKIIKGGGADTTINQDGDSKAHLNLVYRF